MIREPEILQLFAVPIAFVDSLVDTAINAALVSWVLGERMRDEAGIRRSVVGGWHSRPDLPHRGVAPLDALFVAIIEQVRSVQSHLGRGSDLQFRFMLQAWATVMESGHYVQVHDHSGAHWSVVYYVDAGDSDSESSGRISWINPIGAHRDLPGLELTPTSFSCVPRSGSLVIFPGWLRHSVEPYQGRRPRIVISANIEVQQHGKG